MVTCPNCGRPVAGRARACGYCGQSLVQDYFDRSQQQDTPRAPSGALTASAVLGAFGVLSLLAAAVFQVLAALGFGPAELAPAMDRAWILRTLVMAACPLAFLAERLSAGMGRVRFVWSCVWLFLATCGLLLVTQLYFDEGSGGFYGMLAIPYLLVVGCALVLVSSVCAVLGWRRA